MPHKQLLIASVAAGLLAVGLGIVLKSRGATQSQATRDHGKGKSTMLDETAERLERASKNANEAAAISTLRWISSAEAQAVAADVIDVDGDRQGEYAYLGELAGTAGVRSRDGVRGEVVRPALLESSFGEISRAGIARKSGYLFKVFLPGAAAAGKIPALPEAAGGGCSAGEPFPDPDNCEVLWSVYAWPIEAGKTGDRAFFLNQEGDLLATANTDRTYDGEAASPAFDAAMSKPNARDMGAPLGTPGVAMNDGQVWSVVGP